MCCSLQFSSQFWNLFLAFTHTTQHILPLFLCSYQTPEVIHNGPEYTVFSISWQISFLAEHQQWLIILYEVEPFCTERYYCCRVLFVHVGISSWDELPNRQRVCIEILFTTISVSQHVRRVATADIAGMCLSTLLSRLRVYPSWIVIVSPRLGDAASDKI